VLEFRADEEQEAGVEDLGGQSIVIGANCSLTPGKEGLIFQLAVTSVEGAQRGPSWPTSQLAGLSFAGATSNQEEPRIWLAELAEGAANADEEAQNDQGAGGTEPVGRGRWRGRRKNGIKRASLGEQEALLERLVFTIRASNLLATSEPRAILGSELKLSEQGSGWRQRQLQAKAQVTRSEFGSEELPAKRLLADDPSSSQRHQASRRWRNGTSPAAGARGWQHRFEISVTIVAICGTVVLSILTLSLIVLVLRGRKLTTSESVKATDGREPAQTKWGQQDYEASARSRVVVGESELAQMGATGWVARELTRDAPTGQQVDFLAPPARESKLVAEVGAGSVVRAIGCQLAPARSSLLSLATAGELGVADSKLELAPLESGLFVIEGEQASLSAELNTELGSRASSCASERLLCGRHLHLDQRRHLAGACNWQTVGSCCSPSGCNSCSQHGDEQQASAATTATATTTTSELPASLLGQQQAAKLESSAKQLELTDCEAAKCALAILGGPHFRHQGAGSWLQVGSKGGGGMSLAKELPVGECCARNGQGSSNNNNNEGGDVLLFSFL